MVQEHCSLPDIFKFQSYNIREFALEGGLVNIRALSTRLCFILYYSEAPQQGNLQAVWVRDSMSHYEIGSLYCL